MSVFPERKELYVKIKKQHQFLITHKTNAFFEHRVKMSQMSEIMEQNDGLKRKPTLVRRVSDMFKGK